ncbi:MAG: hypothetical protein KGZ25_00485 [Planctomycetes bacterium]|nr:hypothetical protein [Planctomycetota bacterium]
MAEIQIGWSEGDLTPEQPVLIAGQFHARVSEGVADPITTTSLAIETETDRAILVSCDLVGIPDHLREAVRSRLAKSCPGVDPMKVFISGTHTHTGPEIRVPETGAGHSSRGTGVDLDVMPVEEYIEFAVERIARTVAQAWESRMPGSIAFGQDYAVVGRNRRWVDVEGKSTMYGNTDTPKFSHIEGYEDHSVGVLATKNSDGELTGLIVNVPCPAQVSEHKFVLSADYWCETRKEIRDRLDDELFILPQCSAAGDQSPHLLYGERSARRMLDLKGQTEREAIAERITHAVENTLECIGTQYEDEPVLKHEVLEFGLPMTNLTEDDRDTAEEEAERLREQYESEKQKLEADPSLKNEPRWYRTVTRAYRRMNWFRGVVERFEAQQEGETFPIESHVLRLGDAAFGTVPFEYYLDFGVYIKARSKALQTFLVQLTGRGTYVPSKRSVAGGGYGSIPASNPVGPEGGRRLAEEIVETISELF